MTTRRCLSATSNRYRRSSARLGTLSAVLGGQGPASRQEAGQIIEQQFLLLETAPDIGRPYPELRELVIAFEDSGYVVAPEKSTTL